LRPAWDALYASDVEARFFQSSAWIRGLAKAFPGTWSVASVRSRSKGLVALLPLSRKKVYRRGLLVERLLHTGGNVGDSTGLVCARGSEEAAIASLASHISQREKWDVFKAFDVADPRLRTLVERVAGAPERVVAGKSTAIPFIRLPGDWETYLNEKLSSRRREDLRRAMRAIEKLPSYRSADVTEATFDADFAAVIRLRGERWGSSFDADMRLFYPIMRSLFDDGLLWLRMFWSGSEPVAAIGGMPDRARGIFWYYWGVFNAAHAKLSPGKAAMGVAIRHAIDEGFHTFSLTYGDEAYKATFGTEEDRCRELFVERRSARALLVKSAVVAAARIKGALGR
jgi:CelD/BcsL family acetyltransferase involved in cellulose biosynthesis